MRSLKRHIYKTAYDVASDEFYYYNIQQRYIEKTCKSNHKKYVMHVCVCVCMHLILNINLW